MQKILVWLSGWVDSAVSAYLLKKQWHDVTAGFMINYMDESSDTCTTRQDIKVAKEVAKYLDIPFLIFDYRDEYEEKVLDYMYEWYKKGITPNPDIMCNSEIKFKVFLEEALDFGYDKVATGHYARIEESTPPSPAGEGVRGWGWDKTYHLLKWVDENKDQSYFLAGLNQRQLSKALFPIWNLKKSEVRKIAREAWLPNADRKDSQGICFVWKVDFDKFLEKKIEPKEWNIVDTSGKVLWKHKWVYYYTIGQRKGLDLWGQKEPVFVVRKDIEKNEIVVGTKDDMNLYDDRLVMSYLHFLWRNDFHFPLKVKAKIRYRQRDQDVVVEKYWEDKFLVKFKDKQRAIASGQICAIYLGDELVISGVIE